MSLHQSTFIIKFFSIPLQEYSCKKMSFTWRSRKRKLKGPLLSLTQLLTAKSHLEMMKNAFYFMLQALFVLKTFTFLFWLFDYVEKRLDKKGKFNSNFITSQTEQQIITIYILPNIWRTKDNQTMKFGQLIKYNVRNVFLQKLCRKWDRNTSSKSIFFKKRFYMK